MPPRVSRTQIIPHDTVYEAHPVSTRELRLAADEAEVACVWGIPDAYRAWAYLARYGRYIVNAHFITIGHGGAISEQAFGRLVRSMMSLRCSRESRPDRGQPHRSVLSRDGRHGVGWSLAAGAASRAIVGSPDGVTGRQTLRLLSERQQAPLDVELEEHLLFESRTS